MINCIQLLGRITKDAEKRTFENGNSVLSFPIVIDNGYYDKNSQGWVEKPHFFDVKYFRDKELQKGDLVAVVGKLVQEKWINQNGENRSKVLVNAERVRIVKKSGFSEQRSAENADAGYYPNAQKPNTENSFDDDLPF